MKCKCGFEGRPEFGIFRDMKMFAIVHMRCPRCKNGSGVFNPEDRVESEIRNPEECHGPEHPHPPVLKRVELYTGEGDLGGYSIYCPRCNFGVGSGLKMRDVIRLSDLMNLLSLVKSLENYDFTVKPLRDGLQIPEEGNRV